MKILLHYPEWGNRWIPYFKNQLGKYDLAITHSEIGAEVGELSEKADVLISMWCNGIVTFWGNFFPEKKIITYIRRYEIWETTLLDTIRWDYIDATIFVSEFVQKVMNSYKPFNVPPENQWIIPNGVDTDSFIPIISDPNSKKIAMVCSIKNVKNIPLACQILMQLPEEYHIHHIGLPFNFQMIGQMTSYIKNIGLEDRFHLEGVIEPHEVMGWLKDKRCILSTSLNEGNPLNVIEAMSMGIRPVIHNWPGATEQFHRRWIFNTIDEACALIRDPYPEDGVVARQHVLDNFSLRNYERIHDVIDQVTGYKKEAA